MAQRPRRGSPGCLIALSVPILLVIAVKVGGYISVDNQRAIWASHAPRDYVLTAEYVAFSAYSGVHTLTVHDGQGSLENGVLCAEGCPFLPTSLFDEIQGCSDYFPLVICSVRYDPTYGYATDFTSVCLLGVVGCGTSMTAHYFKPSQ